MFKLLLPYEVPASVLDKYKDTFEFVGAVDGKEEISMDEAKELIRDCDAIFSMRVFPIPEELLACGEKLRVVTNHGVGYDHIDVAACSRRGILAINTPQAVCEPTAEFTMALLLGITKGITMFDRNLRRDRVCNIGVFFDRDILLYGKTVGIVGFGRIGQQTGRIARALGMKILAYDKAENDSGRAIGTYVDLDELLSASDVIALHCPLFPDTQGIINKDTIAKMKDGVILLNNSRGQLVVEQDLADALNSGKVYAAGLDVVSTEPIRGDNPLLGAKNCFITPHISWAPRESRQRIMDCAVDNVKAYLRGQPIHVVN